MSTELLPPEDEPVVRLLVFGAALLAIANRESTLVHEGDYVDITAKAVLEAHSIAETIIDEAHRLEEIQT